MLPVVMGELFDADRGSGSSITGVLRFAISNFAKDTERELACNFQHFLCFLFAVIPLDEFVVLLSWQV